MLEGIQSNMGPVVSIILPTFNRPLYMAQALSSAVRQEYGNLQIIVANDGGCDVSGIVSSFNDPRIVFINRRENRGLPFTLNESLARAKGKYVCYLGDDDLLYPNHVGTLVDALENRTDCLVAYTDLYKTYCRINSDQTRTALSKVVEISRDFDRFVMLYFNHVLHVSMMHRTDLIDKTGTYNENLNVMIDWDMTRRIAFFSDFYHIPEITGEFNQPVGDTERISVKRRKDKAEYARNVLAIRTTRPAKPWSKLADLSIIFLTERLNRDAGNTVGLIWHHTFYPYKLYLPLPFDDFSRINTDMPNIVMVPVDPACSQLQRIDRILADCEGEYVAVVPVGFPIRNMWLEDSLYALLNTTKTNEALELEDSTPDCWAVVARKGHLQLARSKFPHLSLRDGLISAGVNIRRIRPDEIPFQFDTLVKEARDEEKADNWKRAAEIYEHIGEHYHNQLLTKSWAAWALFRAGDLDKAYEFASWINQRRLTADMLLLEAKIKRRRNDFKSALVLLKKAEEILVGSVSADIKTSSIATKYYNIA